MSAFAVRTDTKHGEGEPWRGSDSWLLTPDSGFPTNEAGMLLMHSDFGKYVEKMEAIRPRANSDSWLLTSGFCSFRLLTSDSSKSYEQTQHLIENTGHEFSLPNISLKTHGLFQITQQLYDSKALSLELAG